MAVAAAVAAASEPKHTPLPHTSTLSDPILQIHNQCLHTSLLNAMRVNTDAT